MRTFSGFITSVLALALTHTAFAAGVTIKPAQVEQRVDPGATKTVMMEVTNNDSIAHVYYPTLRNITGVDDGQHPIFEVKKPGQEASDILAWSLFKADPVTVAPGATASVKLDIVIPKDASPGSHFAGFFFSDKPQGTIDQGATIGYDIGSLINIQVSGQADERALIRYFSTAKSIYGATPVELSAAVENDGNVLVHPVGIVNITNMFGHNVGSLTLNDQAAGVFPKTTREWKASWDPHEVVFGKFTATAAFAVQFSDGSHTLSRNVEFWVLPTNILMPLIVGFLVFVAVAYVMLRLYVKREVRRAKASGVRGATRRAEGLSMFASVTIALLLSAVIALLLMFFYFG